MAAPRCTLSRTKLVPHYLNRRYSTLPRHAELIDLMTNLSSSDSSKHFTIINARRSGIVDILFPNHHICYKNRSRMLTIRSASVCIVPVKGCLALPVIVSLLPNSFIDGSRIPRPLVSYTKRLAFKHLHHQIARLREYKKIKKLGHYDIFSHHQITTYPHYTYFSHTAITITITAI